MADEDHRPRNSMLEVFQRVNKVENELGEVREQLAGITVNLNAQAQTLSRIAVNLETKSATDWKALAGWATVIIALLSLGGAMILQPVRGSIESNTVRVDRLEQNRVIDVRSELSNAESRGRYYERIDRLDRAVERMQRKEDGPAP